MEKTMKYVPSFLSVLALSLSGASWSAPTIVTFESAGDFVTVASTRDAFRAAIGGGTTAGANGSFGGLRREINWDGVPTAFSDPNLLPSDFFNVNSPRGIVYTTPGTGFLVSASTGAAEPLRFGFGTDLQTFSAEKLFTAVNSNITDVQFFVPGTTTRATTTAFGLIFTDVELAGGTKVEFFDRNNAPLFARDAIAGANQGLSFLGITASGADIGRVRITSGVNTLVSNGVLGHAASADFVVMDDFLYAEPRALIAEPSSAMLTALGLLGVLSSLRSRRDGV
jgi:hypothetical protein